MSKPLQLSEFRSFLTGSQAYGTPTNESDIDLVVLVDSQDAIFELANFSQPNKEERCSASDLVAQGNASLRFGKLNLIVTIHPEIFNLWKRGTEYLRSIAPVTREQAMEHFRRLREQIGA